MVSLKVKFSKQGQLRFISHLDFLRLIYRALRRADLPFEVTQGFSRHPRIKFGQALKLGVCGYMDAVFVLKERIAIEDFKQKMEKQLTKDIRIEELGYDK